MLGPVELFNMKLEHLNGKSKVQPKIKDSKLNGQIRKTHTQTLLQLVGGGFTCCFIY